MTDLERRLELALQAIDRTSRNKVKKLTRELKLTQEKLALRELETKQLQDKIACIKKKLTEAQDKRIENEKAKQSESRVAYNYKVRNR